MGSKTISLDKEAYERLRAEKRDGESFSDVVKRLVGDRSWTEVAGIWSDESGKVEDIIDRSREQSRERRERLNNDFDGN